MASYKNNCFLLALTLLLVLIPLTVFAQAEPIDVAVITTGEKDFPVGETATKAFAPPEDNSGVYRIKVACDPALDMKIQLIDDKGNSYGGFYRPAGPCILAGKPITEIIGTWKRQDKDNAPVPIDKTANLQAVVTNLSSETVTKEIVLEMELKK